MEMKTKEFEFEITVLLKNDTTRTIIASERSIMEDEGIKNYVFRFYRKEIVKSISAKMYIEPTNKIEKLA